MYLHLCQYTYMYWGLDDIEKNCQYFSTYLEIGSFLKNNTYMKQKNKNIQNNLIVNNVTLTRYIPIPDLMNKAYQTQIRKYKLINMSVTLTKKQKQKF